LRKSDVRKVTDVWKVTDVLRSDHEREFLVVGDLLIVAGTGK
jgi:hypothetical protein